MNECELSIKGRCTGNYSPLKCDGIDIPDNCAKVELGSKNMDVQRESDSAKVFLNLAIIILIIVIIFKDNLLKGFLGGIALSLSIIFLTLIIVVIKNGLKIGEKKDE